MPDRNDVVILCGGKGMRVKQLFPGLPKPMYPLGGKPFVQYVIEFFYAQGFRRLILSTGYLGEKIKDYFQNHQLGKYLVFSREPSQLLGTAGALKFAQNNVESNNFFVANGDSLCEFDYEDLLRLHSRKQGLATIAVTRSHDRRDAGNVRMNSNSLVTSFQEKTKKKQFINAGIYVFQRDIFTLIPERKHVSLEIDIFPKLVVSRSLYGFPVESDVFDIGTPERYRAYAQRVSVSGYLFHDETCVSV